MSVFYDSAVNGITVMLAVLVFYIPIRILYLKRHKSPVLFKGELLNLLFVLYVSFIAGMLLMPVSRGIALNDGGYYIYVRLPLPGDRSLNLVPFYTIRQQLEYSLRGSSLYPGAFMNLIANLLIFIPLPLFMYSKNRKIKGVQCLLICLAAILAVECIQYFIGRAADVDDVILNILGAAAGVFLCSVSKRKGRKRAA